MNWHSIGRFIQKHLKDGIVIDFGSTTTDFICIKDYKSKITGLTIFIGLTMLN